MKRKLEITASNIQTCIAEIFDGILIHGSSSQLKNYHSFPEENYTYRQTIDCIRRTESYLLKALEFVEFLGTPSTMEYTATAKSGTVKKDPYGTCSYQYRDETGTISLVRHITGRIDITRDKDGTTICITLETMGKLSLESPQETRTYYPDQTILKETTGCRTPDLRQ